MRGLALVVVLALLLAGCTTNVYYPEPKPSGEPISTRSSRAGGANAGAGNVATIPQNDDNYTFSLIGEYWVKFRRLPSDPAPPPIRIFVGGNASHLKIRSQFYVVGPNPIHSGSTLISGTLFPPRPTMVASVKGFNPPFSHPYTSFFVPPNTSGSPQPSAFAVAKTIRIQPAIATELVLVGNGWGDLEAKVIIEDAQLKPPKNGATGP